MRCDKSVVSLFCGCGGFDQGFKQSGYTCKSAYDIDLTALDIFNANIGNVGVKADLSEEDIVSNDIVGVDVLLSGSPCQGFSTAGKRRHDDPRNQLMVKAGEIASKVKPKVFIAENVRGALSGSHQEYWEQLRNTLIRADYRCHDFVVDCRDLGMAQSRKRVTMVAWNTGKDVDFNLSKRTPQTLRQVLRGIPEDVQGHEKAYLAAGSDDYKIACQIDQGQKLSNVRGGDRSVHTWDIPQVFGVTDELEKELLDCIRIFRRRYRVREVGDADPVSVERLEPLFDNVHDLINGLVERKYLKLVGQDHVDLVNTFNGKYRRLEWAGSSYTVDTRFGNPKYFLHPEEHRGFTVREAARIQGFSDQFVFSGNESAQYRMVGNAVPPPLSEALARIVHDILA